MIRKLKVGEIIRGGDFYTDDDRHDGGRYYIGPFGPLAGVIDTGTGYPIFREIPDSHTVEHKTGAHFTKSSDWILNTHTKESLRAYGGWIVELSEFIEAEVDKP